MPAPGETAEESWHIRAIIPACHGEQVVACFVLGSGRDEEILAARRPCLETAAAQAVNAARRIQAEEEVRKARLETDRRIEERTDAMAMANFVLGQEVHERKQMEFSIHQYAERLEALREIDRGILAARSPQAIAEAALRHIRRLVPCQRVGVIEFDLAGRQARFLAAQPESPTSAGKGAVISLTSFRIDLLEEGHFHLVDDLAGLVQPSEFDHTLAGEGVRSYLNVPLVLRDELVGCINLGSASLNFFSKDHIAIASEIASSLAVAIRNARLHEQTQRDAETKAILLHEVNHRVKNNLAAIIGLLFAVKHNVRQENQSQLNPLHIINDLIGRIQGLATTHRLLSAAEWAPVSLRELAHQVITACLHALSPSKKIALEVEACDLQVPPKAANSVALAISELTTNTIKYALAERPTARITVAISVQNALVLLEYRDDGPGYPAQVLDPNTKNVGLFLVQAIVRNELQGVITFHNENGAVARMRFKVPEMKELLYDGARWRTSAGR